MENEAGVYTDPLTDFGFKRLFGSEPNKDILIHFLNSILPKHHQIANLEYKSIEGIGLAEEDRWAYFDLHCQSTTGETFIVEMQRSYNQHFLERTVYYSTFPIQRQMEKGVPTSFLNFKAVYMIGICNFLFENEPERNDIIAKVSLMYQKHSKIATNKVNFWYVQLPNFNKTLDQLETQQDKWLYLLRNITKLSQRPAKLQEKVYQRFFEQAEIARLTNEEQEQYHRNKRNIIDSKDILESAKEKGKAEGLAEGLAEGEAKGKLKEKRQTALALISKGMDNKFIEEVTGLPIPEIEKLRKQ